MLGSAPWSRKNLTRSGACRKAAVTNGLLYSHTARSRSAPACVSSTMIVITSESMWQTPYTETTGLLSSLQGAYTAWSMLAHTHTHTLSHTLTSTPSLPPPPPPHTHTSHWCVKQNTPTTHIHITHTCAHASSGVKCMTQSLHACKSCIYNFRYGHWLEVHFLRQLPASLKSLACTEQWPTSILYIICSGLLAFDY